MLPSTAPWFRNFTLQISQVGNISASILSVTYLNPHHNVPQSNLRGFVELLESSEVTFLFEVTCSPL
jgi:hypothetical protein